MKKLCILFVLVAFIAASGIMISGCKKTENNPPTITYTGIVNGQSYFKDQVLTFTVTINSNDGDLKTLTINPINVLPPTVVATVPTDVIDPVATTSPLNFKSGNHSISITFNANLNTAGQVTLQFVVTDSNDETAQATVVITVIQPNIVAHSLELGDQASATGSFGASYEGEVYTLTQASSNYAKIDIIYFYNTTFGDAFYSPDDSDIQNETWGGVIDWANWTPKNSTRFTYITDTNFDFANATYADIITAAAGATDYKAIDLQIGNVFGFITTNDRYGILRITNISGTVGGTVQFDVKIVDM